MKLQHGKGWIARSPNVDATIIIIIIIDNIYIAPGIICKEVALRRFTTIIK